MWTWRQRQGELWSDGERIATGYAGRGEGKNNPAAEHIARTGPIPRGLYTVTGVLADGGHMGAYVLTLEPDPANQMHGRSGFCIHGDSVFHPGTASLGCIILPRNVRRMIWESGDYKLTVESGDEPQKEPQC